MITSLYVASRDSMTVKKTATIEKTREKGFLRSAEYTIIITTDSGRAAPKIFKCYYYKLEKLSVGGYCLTIMPNATTSASVGTHGRVYGHTHQPKNKEIYVDDVVIVKKE